MGSPRIKGNALLLTIDGIDYWTDCSSVVIDQDDSGKTPTYSGITLPTNLGWHMDVTAVQSTAEGSLWRLLFEGTLTQWVDYEYSPYGDVAPTADKPHFTGQLWPAAVTTLGGEAGEGTEYVFSVTLPLDGKPQIITEPT